jgi:transcriptional regulator with XRE-family HTH domain
MKFRMLQENLRKILWERIDAEELTGLHLAEQTGFKQAHISNFLNRKRGLSLEGMDKVLNVQHLSVLDLIDPAEVNKRASILHRARTNSTTWWSSTRISQPPKRSS